MGRPRIIQSPEEFEARADSYFDLCKEEDRPPTVSGCALHMGFHDRGMLNEYEQRPEFSSAVKAVKSRLMEHHEARMSGNSPTGSIFWLKNFGWRDQSEVKHSGEMKFTRIEAVVVDPAG